MGPARRMTPSRRTQCCPHTGTVDTPAPAICRFVALRTECSGSAVTVARPFLQFRPRTILHSAVRRGARCVRKSPPAAGREAAGRFRPERGILGSRAKPAPRESRPARGNRGAEKKKKLVAVGGCSGGSSGSGGNGVKPLARGRQRPRPHRHAGRAWQGLAGLSPTATPPGPGSAGSRRQPPAASRTRTAVPRCGGACAAGSGGSHAAPHRQGAWPAAHRTTRPGLGPRGASHDGQGQPPQPTPPPSPAVSSECRAVPRWEAGRRCSPFGRYLHWRCGRSGGPPRFRFHSTRTYAVLGYALRPARTLRRRAEAAAARPALRSSLHGPSRIRRTIPNTTVPPACLLGPTRQARWGRAGPSGGHVSPG